MRVREKFDPDRVLIVNKPFRWAGDPYKEGDTFPDKLTSYRKMRQLYDARFLRHGPFKAEQVQLTGPAPLVMPEFKELSADGLRNWLLNNDVPVDALDVTRDEMVALAERKWRALHNLPEPNGFVAETKVVDDLGFKEDPAAAVKVDLVTEEQTNGVATANGDSEHRGERVQRPADAGRSQAPARKRLGQRGRSDSDVRDIHRRGN